MTTREVAARMDDAKSERRVTGGAQSAQGGAREDPRSQEAKLAGHIVPGHRSKVRSAAARAQACKESPGSRIAGSRITGSRVWIQNPESQSPEFTESRV